MGKRGNGERKTSGSFVIENNENIFMMRACSYSGRLPLISKKQNK